MNKEQKTCQNCKNEFTVEPEDFDFYEKFDIPSSRNCPLCRWKHLLSFWVFGRFRITKSDLSGKRIITVFPENVPFPIYERQEFLSDAWDPMQYGMDYDPSKSFFNQLKELQSKVPHPHQTGARNANCDWADDWWQSKDCFLCRSGIDCEDILYGYRIGDCKNSVDITYCFKLAESYDCLYCYGGYKVRHSFNSRDCVESAFLYDCNNCSNCFMSWNLRNKQYCILNKQYTKEEYFQKLKEYDLSSYETIQKLKAEFWELIKEQAIHRENLNIQTVNSTGNFLTGCKNCKDCYFGDQSEDLRYCFRTYKAKDVIDSVSVYGENFAVGALDQFGYGNIGLLYSTNCRYSGYLDNCEDSEYCFGCVGLRKKKYCILNKQHTKEEYEKLSEEIKTDMRKRDEWGRPMPVALAYSGYNLSLAQIMFPQEKEQVIASGGRWDDFEVEKHEGAIESHTLPDIIDEAKDDLVKKRVICDETGLSYNISKRELEFYRIHKIPLPRQHFDQRTKERFKPMILMVYPQKGVCVFCKREITHYYHSSLEFKKIACVDCYQKEVI